MNEKDIRERKEALELRLKEIKALEAELKKKESAKKQVPLRLTASLYDEISKWADEDFRSVNGQIEFILTEALRKRKKTK